MTKPSKEEQKLAEEIGRFVQGYRATEIINIVKQALPELAKEAGYVMGQPNLGQGSQTKQELASVIGTTLDGQPLIKQVGEK